MALFKKKNSVPPIVPVQTHLDQDWFATWINEILVATGIPGTEGELAGMCARATNLLMIVAARMMEREGAAWAIEQMRAFADTADSTPWDMVSFIAGWDVRTLDNLEFNLEGFKPKMIEAGQVARTFAD